MDQIPLFVSLPIAAVLWSVWIGMQVRARRNERLLDKTFESNQFNN